MTDFSIVDSVLIPVLQWILDKMSQHPEHIVAVKAVIDFACVLFFFHLLNEWEKSRARNDTSNRKSLHE